MCSPRCTSRHIRFIARYAAPAWFKYARDLKVVNLSILATILCGIAHWHNAPVRQQKAQHTKPEDAKYLQFHVNQNSLFTPLALVGTTTGAINTYYSAVL